MKALIFNIQKFSLHDGQGIRTTVFFKGCSLRCEWCCNPESLSSQPEVMHGKVAGKYYTLEEVMAEVLKDKPFYDGSGGGVTLSGGEPMLQAEFVCALCDALHAAGITAGIETAANVPAKVFDKVLKKCDFIQIDLKHWDDEKHRQGTGAGNRLIIANLRHALSGDVPVIVRIPVVPGFNSSDADARAYAALLLRMGVRDVQLLPFHQLGESKYTRLGMPYAYSGVPQLHGHDLTAYTDILAAAGLKVQIGG